MLAAFESALGDAGGAIEEGRVLLAVDETARKHLGRTHEPAGLRIDGDDDDEDAVGGEVGAVAEDVLVHIANAEAVDVDVAGLDAAREAGLFLVDLEDITVGEDEGVAFGHAHTLREAGVGDEVAVLAVDGDEVLGLEDALDDLELVLAGVATDVHVLDAVVEDAGALAEEVVDVAGDGLLVSGDGVGGEDDGVAFGDGDVAVGAVGDAREGARGLAWLPVVMITSREGGVFFISSTPTIVPSGASR